MLSSWRPGIALTPRPARDSGSLWAAQVRIPLLRVRHPNVKLASNAALVMASPLELIVHTSFRDHTARLWDVASQRCRQTFRGHVDSVNAVAWQPFTNNLCTGSGDKTVSLWDARSGLCMQVGQPDVTILMLADVSGREHIRLSLEHLRCIEQKWREGGVGGDTSLRHAPWCMKAKQPFYCGSINAFLPTLAGLVFCAVGWAQTFYGHTNAVNHVCCSLRGDMVSF